MKSEMDIFGMNEQARICWLKANRITLIVVGMVWIGMIVQQLFVGNRPWFLIVMVPVFALLRFAAYSYYKKTMLK